MPPCCPCGAASLPNPSSRHMPSRDSRVPLSRMSAVPDEHFSASVDAAPHPVGQVMRLVKALKEDALELTRAEHGKVDPRAVASMVLCSDAYRVLMLQRLREAARGLRIPLGNHVLRVAQTALLGVEIGKNVELGRGVYFVHSLGTVIGGDARVGERVRFYGNNTVGTAKDNGYPVIEEDVRVGAGARILGPVTVGARSYIAANAVVLKDVPPDSVAVGIPARILPRRQPARDGVASPIRCTGG